MNGTIFIGYLIVGAACLTVGAVVGFKVGLKKGKAIIDDLTRRRNEAEKLLVEVKEAAEKGSDDLVEVGNKVKKRIDNIL